jgi:hypothetical protein
MRIGQHVDDSVRDATRELGGKRLNTCSEEQQDGGRHHSKEHHSCEHDARFGHAIGDLAKSHVNDLLRAR